MRTKRWQEKQLSGLTTLPFILCYSNVLGSKVGQMTLSALAHYESCKMVYHCCRRLSTFKQLYNTCCLTNILSILFSPLQFKLMVPQYASSNYCQWVYGINYGGGLVSGDEISLQIDVEEGCAALLTTQGSTKVCVWYAYHLERNQFCMRVSWSESCTLYLLTGSGK